MSQEVWLVQVLRSSLDMILDPVIQAMVYSKEKYGFDIRVQGLLIGAIMFSGLLYYSTKKNTYKIKKD